MAKFADLTVEVKVNIDIEQAERALKVVEWFLNDNPEYEIYSGTTTYDGRKQRTFGLTKN